MTMVMFMVMLVVIIPMMIMLTTILLAIDGAGKYKECDKESDADFVSDDNDDGHKDYV